MTRAVLLVVAAMLVPGAASRAGQEPWPRIALDASRHYSSGSYREAVDGYQAALRADGRPELAYNLGNALYRVAEGDSAQLASALAAYQKAAAGGDASLRTAALYNAANTSFRLADLARAEAAYREVLRRDPGDEDARYNLELVQRLLQQGQPSPQQEGGQGQGDQDQQKDQQDQQSEQRQQSDREQQEKQDQQDDQEPRDQQDRQDQQSRQDQRDQHDEQDQQQGAQEGTEEQQPQDLPAAGDQAQETPVEQPSPISPEEARRQLEKLDEAERALLRQLLRARQRRVDVERDW